MSDLQYYDFADMQSHVCKFAICSVLILTTRRTNRRLNRITDSCVNTGMPHPCTIDAKILTKTKSVQLIISINVKNVNFFTLFKLDVLLLLLSLVYYFFVRENQLTKLNFICSLWAGQQENYTSQNTTRSHMKKNT